MLNTKFEILNESFRYADQLEIGDVLLVQGNNGLTPAKVINISNLIMQGIIVIEFLGIIMLCYCASCDLDFISFLILGAFVPVTINGKILVDGVLASCFPGSYHDLVHLVITPMQRFSEVVEWFFGNDAGFPVYVDTADILGTFCITRYTILE